MQKTQPFQPCTIFCFSQANCRQVLLCPSFEINHITLDWLIYSTGNKIKWHHPRGNANWLMSMWVNFVLASRHGQWHRANAYSCLPLAYSCYLSSLKSNIILLTTIKFTTFKDYLKKFKDFKALDLVQSNSRLFKSFKAPYRVLTLHYDDHLFQRPLTPELQLHLNQQMKWIPVPKLDLCWPLVGHLQQKAHEEKPAGRREATEQDENP